MRPPRQIGWVITVEDWAFIGKRQLHQTMTATIDIDVPAGVGGIAVRTDEQSHYSIVAGQGQVTARACISGFERVEKLPFSGTTVELEISSQSPAALRGESRSSDTVVLAALIEGRRTVLLDIDGRYLSYEISDRLAGRVVGIVALEGQISVDWFDYKGSDD
jgi:hypothetical protein